MLFLSQYAKSHEEADYQNFQQAIAVPLGDCNARIALDRPDPDLDAARRGFQAARNHQEDIAGMIRLFRNFRHVSFMSEVIAIWAEADGHVQQLCTQARLLHDGISSGAYDDASVHASLERIELVNLRLNPMEEEFSARLGDALRKTQYFLLLATRVIGSVLMGICSVISRSILKKNEGFENALRISEGRLNLAMSGNSDDLWDWDIAARSIYYSPRMKEMFEEDSLDTVYPERHFFKYVHPDDFHSMRADVESYLRDNTVYDVEFRIVTQTGKVRWVRSRAQSALDANGQHVRMAGSVTDITERKQAALELMRTNRALQMLSRCNEAVMRAENENQLLSQICRLAVDIGGYRTAWVRYARDDEARSIAPAAQAGNREDTDCLGALSWSEDDAAGQGAAGITIRCGTPVLFDDITHLSKHAHCLQPGRSGGICLPLRAKGHTFGLLALYSSDVLKVSAEETMLLQQLADDLAFGITSIRVQDEQQRIQSAVLKIAAGVSASTGTAFFEQLVHNMAEALGASAGFVNRLLPGSPGTMRTIAGVSHGCVVDNFEYAIPGSPCENLMLADNFIVAEKVALNFQLPAALLAVDAQAYVGRRLVNSAGQPGSRSARCSYCSTRR